MYSTGMEVGSMALGTRLYHRMEKSSMMLWSHGATLLVIAGLPYTRGCITLIQNNIGNVSIQVEIRERQQEDPHHSREN